MAGVIDDASLDAMATGLWVLALVAFAMILRVGEAAVKWREAKRREHRDKQIEPF